VDRSHTHLFTRPHMIDCLHARPAISWDGSTSRSGPADLNRRSGGGGYACVCVAYGDMDAYQL